MGEMAAAAVAPSVSGARMLAFEPGGAKGDGRLAEIIHAVEPPAENNGQWLFARGSGSRQTTAGASEMSRAQQL